jgi:hypothetical protein
MSESRKGCMLSIVQKQAPFSNFLVQAPPRHNSRIELVLGDNVVTVESCNRG